MVHLATQVALGRDVALKTTITDSDPSSEDALLQEARVMGLIEHPNVVPVHLIGRNEDGRPVIVMKRVEGRTWDELLQEDPDDRERHIEILTQACRALEYAHEIGILHRDIKPANIMVGTFGEVYVMDWGLAVSLGDAELGLPRAIESKSVVGTPAYIAPEMTIGASERLAPSTDVYLLGAVLFEVATGEPPHSGRTLFEVFRSSYEGKPRVYPAHVPKELQSVISRAMSVHNEDRYQTVKEFRLALEAYKAHRSSVEIAQEAKAQLQTLRSVLEGSSIEVYRAFGAARFGFEQAIHIWADNDDARDGLRATLIEMFGYEEVNDNLEAATALYDDIQNPDAELTARLEALRDRVHNATQELQSLRNLKREFDANVALDKKSIAIGVFAFLWLPFIWVREWTHGLGLASEAWPYFGTSASFFPILVLITILGREAFRANLANRALIRTMWLLWIAGWFMHIAPWVAGAPLHLGTASELMMFATALAALGIVSDRRVLFPSVLFALGAIATVLWPAHMYTVYALSGFLGSIAYAVSGLLGTTKS
ncbi:MAG: serine/threonine-protein kinase [bacterium]